jgi:hypothetical protein
MIISTDSSPAHRIEKNTEVAEPKTKGLSEHKSQSALQVCSNVLKPLFINMILTEETFLGPHLIY